MFGSNKENGKVKSSTNSSQGGSLNSLVQGTVIEGTLRSESDIRIDGTIKGKLICNAKVILGPTGRIEGEIKCRDAVIEGTFSGELEVGELLNIRETASVEGEVHTQKLIVQSGAEFNVSCTMGSGSAPKSKKDSEKVVKVSKTAEA